MITSLSSLHTHKQPLRFKNQSLKSQRLQPFVGDVVTFKGEKKFNEQEKPEKKGFVEIIFKAIAFIFNILKSVFGFFVDNSLQNIPQKFNKEWEDAGNKPLDRVIPMNIVNLPGIIYNPSNNLVGLNYAKIRSNRDIKYNVNVLENLVETSKRLGPKIDQITRKSAERLQIPELFVPNVNLYYEESGRMGFYAPGDHFILLNAYHIDEAHDPESIISEVISHELSHAKSNMDFSIVDNVDITDKLKSNSSQKSFLNTLASSEVYADYRKFRTDKEPVGEKEYARIKYHIEKHLSTLTDNESMHKEAMKAESFADNVFSTIKKHTGLGYKELGLLDTAQLVNNKKVAIDPNNFHAHAQFDDEMIEAILTLAEANKNGISFLLAKLNEKQQKLLKAHMKYQDIYDESIARMNSSRVTSENFKEGVINKTKAAEAISKTHINDLLDLLLRTDDEVRAMVESGDVQLDKRYIECIAMNKDYYKNLDLSKQNVN